jgi:uncharacterized protein
MKDKLKTDSTAALKNHDSVRVGVLRYLISLIDKKELQLPPGQMNEATEIAVLRKELKDKQEAREMFIKGNREDLVKETDFEIAVVKEYLPAEITDEELNTLVDEVVAEAGGIFGIAMKAAMTKAAGRAGGDRIAPLIKAKISNG